MSVLYTFSLVHGFLHVNITSNNTDYLTPDKHTGSEQVYRMILYTPRIPDVIKNIIIIIIESIVPSRNIGCL